MKNLIKEKESVFKLNEMEIYCNWIRYKSIVKGLGTMTRWMDKAGISAGTEAKGATSESFARMSTRDKENTRGQTGRSTKDSSSTDITTEKAFFGGRMAESMLDNFIGDADGEREFCTPRMEMSLIKKTGRMKKMFGSINSLIIKVGTVVFDLSGV